MASEMGNTVLEPSISTVGACCAKEGATRRPRVTIEAAEEAKAARAGRKVFVLCVMTTLCEFRKAERDIRERRAVIVLLDDSFMSTKYSMVYPDRLIFEFEVFDLLNTQFDEKITLNLTVEMRRSRCTHDGERFAIYPKILTMTITFPDF